MDGMCASMNVRRARFWPLSQSLAAKTALLLSLASLALAGYDYTTSGCTACPSDWYTNCPSGYSQYDSEGCGFLGCRLKCRKCSAGYTGSSCSTPTCKTDCDSQHGYCNQPGECICRSGWTGTLCTTPVCSSGCNHGTCTSPGVCTCYSGWSDQSSTSKCTVPQCSNGCNSVHGYCNQPYECLCYSGWQSATCSTPICKTGCSQTHGYCNQPGECLCRSGYTGTLCNSPVQVIATPSQRTITIDAGQNSQSYFRVTVYAWRAQSTIRDVLPSWNAATPTGKLWTVTDLHPGQRFRIEVEMRDQTSQPWSTPFVIAQVDTLCDCYYAVAQSTAGKPESFQVSQHLGYIYFQWTDASMCEQGFSVTRDGISFARRFDFSSDQACDRVFDKPDALYDSIDANGLTIGQSYQYCMTAVSSVGYDDNGYSSQKNCASYTVLWESKVTGRIRMSSSAGSLPVKDVTINWVVVGNEAVTGSATTNGEGYFDFIVSDTRLSTPSQKVLLRVSKLTGDVSHTFECDGIPCSEREIEIQHLVFDNQVDFIDTTSVPIYGKVSIVDTAQYNNDEPCGIDNVKICLYNQYSQNELFSCATTDATGHYTLSATLGTTVFVGIKYNNTHTFVRLRDTGSKYPAASGYNTDKDSSALDYEYFSITEPIYNMDFQDTTRVAVKVQVVGGLCNRSLGHTELYIERLQCGTGFRRVEQMLHSETSILLPAHEFSIKFNELKTNNVNFNNRVVAYLRAMSEDVRYLDLRDVSEAGSNTELYTAAFVPFVYHPEPSLSVDFAPRTSTSCSEQPIVLAQHSYVLATVKVVQKFMSGIADCDYVPGNVTVVNSLVDAATATNTSCHDGCLLPLQYDSQQLTNGVVDYFNSRVTVAFLVGDPETSAELIDDEHPFSRRFTASMKMSGHSIVTLDQPVYVEGIKVISDKFSIQLPEYMPLTVVHDPPGGSSKAFYEAVTASATITVHQHSSGDGTNIEGEWFVGFKATESVCAGLGVSKCSDIADSKVGYKGAKSELSITQNTDGYENSLGFSYTFSYETSDGTEMAGPLSDMFLVPSLNVKFSLSMKITFDTAECTSMSKYITTWSLDSPSNVPIFAWKSAWEIENVVIPEVKFLMDAEVAKLGDASLTSAQISEATSKISTLNETMHGWQGLLDRNRQKQADADAGNLQEHAVKPLVPEVLIPKSSDGTDHVQKIDGTYSDNAADIRAINAISFGGGGQKISYVATGTDTKDTYTGSTYDFDTKVIHGLQEDITLVFVTWDIYGMRGTQSEEHTVDETHTQTTTETTMGFELGDPDAGDYFDIQVFRDPDYNTFIFSTMSGRSECTHEPNTVAREETSISVPFTTLSDLLPNQAAVFELTLANKSPTREFSNYNLFVDLGTNEHGLKIYVDGQFMTAPVQYYGFPFGARTAIMEIYRGPELYEYPPVTVKWMSMCEYAYNYAPYGGVSSSVDLTVNFMQPCSTVEFGGIISMTKSFVMNYAFSAVDNHPNEIYVVGFNTEIDKRKWSDNPRLSKVEVLFRKKGTSTWSAALAQDGVSPLQLAINPKPGEKDYGYADGYWLVSTLEDGEYELMLRTVCKASGLAAPPPGLDESFSSIISGIIDRVPPRMFGDFAFEPSDSEYMPGDEISVSFEEDISCSDILVEMTVVLGSVSKILGNEFIPIYCSANTIYLELPTAFPIDNIINTTVSVDIRNVKDLAGNVGQETVTWKFHIADFGVKESRATIRGLAFSFIYQADMASPTSAAATNLAHDIASYLGISVDRIYQVKLYPAADGTTLADVTFLPSTFAGSRRRGSTYSASELAYMLGDAMQQVTNNGTTPFSNSAYLGQAVVSNQISTEIENPQAQTTTTVTPPPTTSNTTSAPSGNAASTGSTTSGDDNEGYLIAILVFLLIQLIIAICIVVTVFQNKWVVSQLSTKLKALSGVVSKNDQFVGSVTMQETVMYDDVVRGGSVYRRRTDESIDSAVPEYGQRDSVELAVKPIAYNGSHHEYDLAEPTRTSSGRLPAMASITEL